MPCTAFKTYAVPPPTVDEKTLNARVDACIAKLLPVGVLASFLSQPPPPQGCG